VIPSSIGALQKLFYALNLSNNALTGQVPSELGKLIVLQKLDLSHNNLTGTLNALDGMTSLIEVDVSYNSFTGPVPETLMNLLNSSSFYFSSNPSLCVSYLPSCGFTCAGINDFKLCNSQSSKRKGLSKVEIAFVALGSSILVASLLYLLVYLFCLHKRTKQEVGVSAREGQSSLLIKVMEATENLNDRYIIGRGAHGTVYRASLDEDKDLAVKKLVFAGHEGRRLSMVRELQTLGKIRHRNLVKLEDFWLRKDDYGLILYSYMQNGSLHDVLHEISPPRILEWSVRYKIALGTAFGLEYLHYDCDPPIVHRDIKPMNILLDAEMEPHIADFGIAKLLDQSSPSTVSTSVVVGTTGYIAPGNSSKFKFGWKCFYLQVYAQIELIFSMVCDRTCIQNSKQRGI
jgi:tRNA A-37 threonylcarbamoyl transferase component Bud32